MAPHEGLVHPAEYDIEDSNVELINSDIDHKVKFNSAATEPAWNNGHIGTESGLFVWRIEQFEVIPWPKDRYGLFYDGDSFVVLHSLKVGSQDGTERLVHDIFFWLGAKTSHDEAGTAAYKAVELDEFLSGSATQHREVQQAPSDEFLALFPRLSIRAGGVRSGFRHVEGETEENVLTLLRVFKNQAAGGASGLIVYEVDPTWKSLDEGDVFVLDTGAKIWVWQGQECSPMEKAKAAEVVHDMKVAKHAEVEVLSQAESRSRRVIDLLGGDDETPRDRFHTRRPVIPQSQSRDADRPVMLFRLSDASGDLAFELVKASIGDGGDNNVPRITRKDFDSNDIFLLDDGGKAIWVWEGRGASVGERKQWLRIAQAYQRQMPRSGEDQARALTPLAKVTEGNESQAFLNTITA
ncbi:Fc.00g012470.m01.CDS01 [Cosmosporella sp. VM-42]